MKKTILKQALAVAVLAMAAASNAYAGGFVNILNTGERTPGSVNNIAADPFYISSLPSTWTFYSSITSTVFSPVNGNAVGTFIDTLWKDTTTNEYILGSYFKLNNNTNGITEINSIVRTGFADYTGTISAAWTFADSVYSGAQPGYRLRDPSLSNYVPGTYNTTVAAAGGYRDNDKVAIRTDVSIGEQNPNSGLYLIKLSADQYTIDYTANALRIVQGASATEGGRQYAEMWLSGYTVNAVPEAETYAMMLAGLGMIGAIVRRRKSA